MNSQEIKDKIEQNEAEILKLRNLINELSVTNGKLAEQFIIAVENEFTELKNDFFKQYGIENEINARKEKYFIFTKKGKFIKTVDVKKDFESFQQFEEWLKKEKVYAHNASSFCNRSKEWYNMSFKEQLKNLTWNFDKKGVLMETSW